MPKSRISSPSSEDAIAIRRNNERARQQLHMYVDYAVAPVYDIKAGADVDRDLDMQTEVRNTYLVT